MSFQEWTAAGARANIRVPLSTDDKYSRGVLGMVTGSTDYPGAAVLGVEAALHTGVGMVRYLGAGRPTRLVLQKRPEVVTKAGRVQAWVLGSGQDAVTRDEATSIRLSDALAQNIPTVIDAGALDLLSKATGPVVITPHFVKPLADDQKAKLPDWVEEFLPPTPQDKGAGTKKFTKVQKGKKPAKQDASKPEFIGPRGQQEPK